MQHFLREMLQNSTCRVVDNKGQNAAFFSVTV